MNYKLLKSCLKGNCTYNNPFTFNPNEEIIRKYPELGTYMVFLVPNPKLHPNKKSKHWHKNQVIRYLASIVK